MQTDAHLNLLFSKVDGHNEPMAEGGDPSHICDDFDPEYNTFKYSPTNDKT